MAKRANGQGTIFQLANGKWRVGVTVGHKPDGTPIRAWRLRKTKTQALDAQRELQSQVAQNQIPSGNARLTVREAFNTWLTEVVGPNKQPNTKANYTYYAERFILPEIGQMRVRDVKPLNIQRLLNVSRRSANRVSGEDLSPTTVRHLYSVVRNAFNQFVRWDLIPSNPVAKVEAPKARTPRKPVWTMEHMEKFLEGVRGHRYEAYYIMAMTTGLRRSELAALTWDDIDFTKKRVYVTKAMKHLKGKGFYLDIPKSRSGVRDAALTNLAIDALRRHKESWDQLMTTPTRCWRVPKETEWHKIGLVFLNANGRPPWAHAPVDALKLLCRELEIPEVVVHGLRHLYATRLLETGTPVAMVKELRGHSTVTITTDIYGHVLEGGLEEVRETLNRIFK